MAWCSPETDHSLLVQPLWSSKHCRSLAFLCWNVSAVGSVRSWPLLADRRTKNMASEHLRFRRICLEQ